MIDCTTYFLALIHKHEPRIPLHYVPQVYIGASFRERTNRARARLLLRKRVAVVKLSIINSCAINAPHACMLICLTDRRLIKKMMIFKPNLQIDFCWHGTYLFV